jgi:hypothetical protein
VTMPANPITAREEPRALWVAVAEAFVLHNSLPLALTALSADDMRDMIATTLSDGLLAQANERSERRRRERQAWEDRRRGRDRRGRW